MAEEEHEKKSGKWWWWWVGGEENGWGETKAKSGEARRTLFAGILLLTRFYTVS